MSRAEALQLPWVVGGSMLGFLGFIAVILLGLALVGQVRR